MVCRELQSRFLQHCRVGDRVPSIYSFCLVTRHLHRRATRHAGTLKVADGCASKVVDQSARNSSVLASLSPSPAKILYASFVRMNKNPRDDARLFALDRLDHFPLSLKDGSHLRREGKFTTFAIFRFAGVQTQPTLDQIDVAPLPGQ